MAARHFANTAPEEWEDDALDLDFDDFGPRGKHFKEPEVVYVPTHPLYSSVPADADADARARAYIEALMLELDTAPKAEKTNVPVESVAPDASCKPVAPETLDAASPVALAEAQSPTSSTEVPQAPVFGGVSEKSMVAEAAPVSMAVDSSAKMPAHFGARREAAPEEGTPDLTTEQPKVDADDSTSNEEQSLESTLVLDRQALKEQERSAPPASADVRLIEPEYQERLEVSTRLPEPPATPAPPVLSRPERRPGFFASIGAFVARLLHLDEGR